MIRSVLVIDDSETDQFICSCVLEEHNESIEIIKAYDGKEGLEMLATLDKHPELILLDINMPRMNGHEFLEEYHATYDNPTSVVVMLTSSSQLQDKEEAMRYAFVKEYQQKPLSADAVLRLETVLSI